MGIALHEWRNRIRFKRRQLYGKQEDWSTYDERSGKRQAGLDYRAVSLLLPYSFLE